jgi:hypothetical protein
VRAENLDGRKNRHGQEDADDAPHPAPEHE